MLDTILAVRGIKEMYKVPKKNRSNTKRQSRVSLIKKTAVAAVVFMILASTSLLLKDPLPNEDLAIEQEMITDSSIGNVPYKLKDISNNNSNKIALAMSKGYENLESYSGIIEIRTETAGKVDFLETIESTYKRPNKYKAFHFYSDVRIKKMSDGDKLVTIDEDKITVDYLNPEKELWRYHIEQSIKELEEAEDIREVGKEKIAGRDAILYEYSYSDSSLPNRLWIDEATKLPLKKELNLAENGKIVNGFIKIDINPVISNKEFEIDLNKFNNTNIKFLNKKIDIETVQKNWPRTKKLHRELERENYFVKAIDLLSSEGYRYLLKYETKNGEFIDIYLGIQPISNYPMSNMEQGKLKSGWVGFKKDAINVGKIYIGKSNIIKWVTPEFELFIVSDMEMERLKEVLENVAKDKIEPLTKEDLKKPRENSRKEDTT